MRYLLILLLFLLTSFYALADYAPISEIEKKINDCSYVIDTYTMKCENNCIKITKEFNCEYSELIDQITDDYTRPIYEAKSNIVSCSENLSEGKTQEEDCIEKESAHICDYPQGYNVVRLADNTEVYCTKVVGYEQKLTGKKIVSINQAKKDAYDLVESQKEALKQAMRVALRSIECGNRVKARLLVQNAPKGLTTAQRVSLSTTYAPIQSLLESGSLGPAKESIFAVTADGVVITEADKTALIQELDSCKP